ncbi:hypothetical protein [Proteiniborus sp.]|uniref:hypothetical protein n=1 Tax=Proteiniborus sp. TaxID=2079015 RepID=UPI0033274A31
MLPRLIKHEDIFRGKIYSVALPFTNGRPLNFVVEDDTHKGLYKIIKKDDGFEGKVDKETGIRKSEQLKIVTGIKLRPCIVIQKDEYNHNPKYPLVAILPIATLSDKQKERPLFQRMVSHNDVDSFYYLGNDCYITINDPQRVFKNVLFEIDYKLNYNESDVDMQEIMKKFAKCFEIKRIVECDTCKHNCENCEYKKVVNA